MAVAFQAKTNDSAVATTTVVTKPTGTVDGDLLIVGVMRDGGSNIVNSVPSGWTLEQSKSGGASNILYIYSKVASSEGSSWTWGWNGTDTSKRWFCLRFDGGADTPIGASAIDSVDNSSSPSFANTVTPVAADSVLVMMIFSSQGASGISAYAVATNDPTWTERIDDTQSNFAIGVATATRTEITATGNSSATIDSGAGTEDNICCLLSLTQAVDITVSPAVIDATATIQAPTITGGASISPSVIDGTLSVQAPTITAGEAKWKNADKSDTSPTINNKDKS